MVKVHYDEGLTNHIGPESCAAVREDVREALTGVRAGQAIERRNFALREAHALLTAEGNTAMIRIGEDHAVPRRQRPWHVRKSSAREPGDLHLRPGRRAQGRIGKAQLEPMMNGMEESDPSIVPTKPANKTGKPAAEPVEGSDGAKRNASLQSTSRTQSREIVSQAQARIREAVTRNKTEKLTALLHHITVDSLRCVFLELKKNAAPGWMGRHGNITGKTLTETSLIFTGGFTQERIERNHHGGSTYRSRMADNGRSALPHLKTSLSRERWWRFSRLSMRRNFWASATDSGPHATSTKRWMRCTSE